MGLAVSEYLSLSLCPSVCPSVSSSIVRCLREFDCLGRPGGSRAGRHTHTHIRFLVCYAGCRQMAPHSRTHTGTHTQTRTRTVSGNVTGCHFATHPKHKHVARFFCVSENYAAKRRQMFVFRCLCVRQYVCVSVRGCVWV